MSEENKELTIEEAIKEEWNDFENFVNLLKERNEKVLQGHEVEHFAIHLINQFLSSNIETVLKAQDKILLETLTKRTKTEDFQKVLKELNKK